MNGFVDDGDRTSTPKTYLGKRKRLSSTDTNSEPLVKVAILSTDDDLESALQTIRRHDPAGHLLQYPLSSQASGPLSKRQRLNSPRKPIDTIENRVYNGLYTSLDELLEDVRTLQHSSEHVAASERILDSKMFEDMLAELTKGTEVKTAREVVDTNGFHPEETEVKHSVSQVLSLRSQTETGIKQLYSGLPLVTDGQSHEIDGRKLPNGFELTDVAMMDRSKKQTKDNRTFGDVFVPHRNTKPLEAPRADRRRRDDLTIGFVAPHTTNSSSATKFDYKHTLLSTGSWLHYSANESMQPNPDQKTGAEPEIRSISLFKSAFSSFAPTVDHSTAVVPEFDRSRQWWRHYSSRKTILKVPEETDATNENDGEADLELSDDFESLIDNFISESDLENLTASEKLINEASELLETLSSYQTIRDSEHARGPSSANKPTKSEFDIYEMLRAQLQILISELPPFAVAKLNGNQLEALNVSTNLLVTPPEFLGTAQADEHTLRRNKASQPSNPPVSRPSAGVPARNNYATPAATYNSQAHARNAPATAYAARATTMMYNTPRVNSATQSVPYTQPSYRATNSGFGNPTIQQYQRAAAAAAAANTYNQSATPTTQSHMQRPTQPGYQQRAQDNGTAYSRSDSPHAAPLTNGQLATSQQNGQYLRQSNHGNSPVTSQAELNQRVTDSMNLLQQQSAQVRQNSGTPQPPNGYTSELPKASVSGVAS